MSSLLNSKLTNNDNTSPHNRMASEEKSFYNRRTFRESQHERGDNGNNPLGMIDSPLSQHNSKRNTFSADLPDLPNERQPSSVPTNDSFYMPNRITK